MTTLGVEPGTTAGIVDRAWQILAGVVDPEIPAISIVDLGIVGRVTVAGGRLEVELLPTFIGCPALDMIRDNGVRRAGSAGDRSGLGDRACRRRASASPCRGRPERITEHGRRALAASGFAPPGLALAGLPPAGLPAGPGAAPIEVAPGHLPVLRIAPDGARERLRADPVSLDPLLHGLPPAVRAVQGRLSCRPGSPWSVPGRWAPGSPSSPWSTATGSA